MYEPTRGGTRGGQAEFKWTDVSADKDREHYLGHSINAPTGRWQKNKDVHWYNRDKAQSDEAKAQELAKIKELEREALSVALGFKPSKPPGDATTSGPNAIPVPPGAEKAFRIRAPSPGPSTAPHGSHDEEDKTPAGSDVGGGERKPSKEEKRARKAEKRLAKEERRREKQEERERRAMELVARQRQRSASPPPRGDYGRHDTSRRPPRERDETDRDQSNARNTSLTPLKDLPWVGKDRDLSPSLRREVRSGHRRPSIGIGVERPRREYDQRTIERERANDRRRWEENRVRQEGARGEWDRP